MKKIALISLFMILMGATLMADVKSDILGGWKSAAAEDFQNGSFGYRVFEIKKDSWTVQTTIYRDKNMKKPIFVFFADGPYSVGESYSKIEGANKAQFKFSHKYVTLLTNNFILKRMLGFKSLKKDVKTDISQNGISFFKSVAAAPEEFDVVKIENKMLYLGARPKDNDLGSEEKRPTKLNFPLIRVENK